ncbi:glycosyltransferase family 4 protein [Candidatus Saccharibacteria bacterium]|nr:glycosyltransferase family 4 protein [Candidatus Saccharibacteria bacterium]MBQ6313432.1 glycosyltransferase family 4 protein [Candidatus Saccharibacteria bacterium]
MKDNKKNDFTEIIGKLKKENKILKNDNRELAIKLNSKRYKVVDFATDAFYALIRKTNRRKQLINRNLNSDVKNLRAISKRKIVPGRVDIINVNFYDWDGQTVFKGGAERYVYDLACLLKEMGYKPRLLQCSNVPFKKEYNGIEVIGIGAGDKGNIRTCSVVYNNYCKDAEFIIASPLELASEIEDIPVIGINHGVNFDSEWNKYNPKAHGLFGCHIAALKNVLSCVCVDTNFINWTRTQDYALAQKERYIPNYYDPKQFSKMKKRKSDKIVFVYPRRLYSARGADITTKAFERILPEYKDKVELKFIGQVDNEKAQKDLDRIMEAFPKNVFHFEYSMEEMPKAYEGADVVLVPTRYSEGTSLSCIEGMASGAALIVTNVGGLPNLVIDGFNGRIVSPTVDDLVDAIIEMIEDSNLREKMSKNGLMVAKEAFSKKKWEEGWRKEIDRVSALVKKDSN